MMSVSQLSEFVTDWGGFEKLVEALHQTGDVFVQRNVMLVGRSGAPRQIDVLVKHTQGLYDHLTVIECKFWNKRVKRQHVDALATTITEVGASKGVIFSNSGFQSGAIREAKHHNIDLFVVRDTKEEEWGPPGRHVDIWLHVIGQALGPFKFGQALNLSPVPRPPVNLNIFLGDENVSQTAVEGVPEKTLEELIYRLISDATKKSYNAQRIKFVNQVDAGGVRAVINVEFRPVSGFYLIDDHGKVLVNDFSFLLGIEVLQSRIQLDRAKNFLFVLAVEDCVSQRVFAAQRLKKDGNTFVEILRPVELKPGDEPFVNGSLISVMTKGLQPFDQFLHLKPGTLEEFENSG